MIFVKFGKVNLNFTGIPIEQKLSNVKNVSIGIIAKEIVFIPLILKLILHNSVTKSFLQKKLIYQRKLTYLMKT